MRVDQQEENPFAVATSSNHLPQNGVNNGDASREKCDLVYPPLFLSAKHVSGDLAGNLPHVPDHLTQMMKNWSFGVSCEA